MSFRHELGSKAKDKVTGYAGIIIGRTEWLYGCRRYTVQSQEMKVVDGLPMMSVVGMMSFDEDALDIIEAAPKHEMKNSGGPSDGARARVETSR